MVICLKNSDIVRSANYLNWILNSVEKFNNLYNEKSFIETLTDKEDLNNISLLVDFAEYIKQLSGVCLPIQSVEPIKLNDDSLMYQFYYNSHYFDLILNYNLGYSVNIRFSEKLPDKKNCIFLSNREFELVQYIVVNKDLNMSPGKLSAQVGHVCTICAVKELGNALFIDWYKGSQKKIVLAGHQKDLEKLEQEGYYAVRDNGLTEIPSGSLTAVSLGIQVKEDIMKKVKRFQLYK